MMRRIQQGMLSATVLAMAFVPAIAQVSEKEKACAELQCQRDVRITLKQADGAPIGRTYPYFAPIVQGTMLTIAAGQTVYVEAEIVGDEVHLLRAVESNVAPEKTIVARFEQNEHGMILETTNPFEKTLKFDMGISPLEDPKAGVYKTSSCPIGPKLQSFEMWQEPILFVVLGRGRVLPDNDKMVCD